MVVRGGQQQDINYVVHTKFGNSSEQDARRQFDQYKITAYVKGDTAWIGVIGRVDIVRAAPLRNFP